MTGTVRDLAGPIRRAVASAIKALGARSRPAGEADHGSVRERAALREIGALIRSGMARAELVEQVAARTGAAFGVDRVWVRLVATGGAPPLTVDWTRGQPGRGEPVPADRLRPIAHALWDSGDLCAIAEIGPRSAPSPLPGHGGPPEIGELVARSGQSGARAFVAGAVGDGIGVVGLLHLSMTGAARTWTPTELSLIRQVSAELGHTLIQDNIITQQRAMMAQLAAVESERREFVAAVSHELRTPLTSVCGYLEMALDQPADAVSAETRTWLAIAERNATRVSHLIDDLLVQARVEVERDRPITTRCRVPGVLAAVAATMTPLADRAGITLELDSTPVDDPLAVIGDPRRLEQALTNLVANTVKFTPAGGRVELSASRVAAGDRSERAGAEPGRRAGEVLITVRDTGMGIPAEDLPRLAERFFRAGNVVRAGIAGTGLGLAIVREIVEQHAGTLSVTSPPGAGTVVTVRLPAATD